MLTNDRDIISSVIIELTKHFTSLLASYKENNDLIQDNAIIDADVIVIVTEWDQIKNINLEVVKKLMKGNLIIDGRNIFDRNKIEELGFIYEAIGC